MALGPKSFGTFEKRAPGVGPLQARIFPQLEEFYQEILNLVQMVQEIKGAFEIQLLNQKY